MAKGKKLSELQKKSRHTIDSAKKDFGTTIDGYPIKWKITSDDSGRLLEAFCEDNGAMAYMETSAKENMNVEDAFT